MSAIQLVQGDFPEAVQRSLRVSGLDPALLTLELTESVLVPDIQSAGRQLACLRDIGVQIALDDFGTGYSSLAYLSSLPVDLIKLDRRFRQDASTRGAIVFQSIVELAHRLNLQVVAEGVENEDEAVALLALGCDQLQGRHFGAPRSFEEISTLIDASPAVSPTTM